MKPRLVKPALCTVRPLVPGQGDVFGDRTTVTAKLRQPAIERVRIQISNTSGSWRPGTPGVDVRVTAIGVLLDEWGWTPAKNDIVEMPGGRRLFVVDSQAAFPRPISLGNPAGGFYGFRLSMSDLTPEVNPAARYS